MNRSICTSEAFCHDERHPVPTFHDREGDLTASSWHYVSTLTNRGDLMRNKRCVSPLCFSWVRLEYIYSVCLIQAVISSSCVNYVSQRPNVSEKQAPLDKHLPEPLLMWQQINKYRHSSCIQ